MTFLREGLPKKTGLNPDTSKQLEQAVRTAEAISSQIKAKLELQEIPVEEVGKLIPGLIKQLDKILELDPNHLTYKFFPKLSINLPKISCSQPDILSPEEFLKKSFDSKNSWKFNHYLLELDITLSTGSSTTYPELDDIVAEYKAYKKTEDYKAYKKTEDNLKYELIRIVNSYEVTQDKVSWNGNDIKRFLMLENIKLIDFEDSDIKITQCHNKYFYEYKNGLPIIFVQPESLNFDLVLAFFTYYVDTERKGKLPLCLQLLETQVLSHR